MGFDFSKIRVQAKYGWERVRLALLHYKQLYGDTVVPTLYGIPEDDNHWPEDLWGMKLGTVVKEIRSKGQYKDHKEELVEMGFDFRKRR